MFRAIISLVITAFVWWLLMPTMAFDFVGFWLLVVLLGLVYTGLCFITDKNFVLPGSLTAGVVALMLFSSMSGCAMLRSGDYRAQLGEVRRTTLSHELSPVDPSHIRIVDAETAARVADKLIGEDLALGSRAELGELHIQKFGNDIFWVAPVLHSGFFKWWSYSSGTPGYVMVSATNPDDFRFVRKIGNADINIRYQPNAFFGDNLERHVYLNSYMTTGTTQYAFEVDDAGRPFWIVTLYRHEIGMSGSDAYGVLTVDAQNGDIKEYTIANAPTWIDRVQPDDFVNNQINNWGEYIHGWINPSDTEKLKSTSGVEMVYGENGKTYWYTGLTSTGNDESLVGFMLVDSRTKEVFQYNQAGTNESAARASMEGAVSDRRYTASNLVPYVINGRPTYVGALKDAGGLTKAVGMVSVENHMIVGTGSDVRSALRSYQNALSSSGRGLSPDTNTERLTVSGRVLRVSQDTSDRTTSYYLMVEGKPNYIFTGSSSVSFELALTQPGDTVRIEYIDSGNNPVGMSSFDNLSLENRQTTGTQEVQARVSSATTRRDVAAGAQDAEAVWENMTPEERADFARSHRR